MIKYILPILLSFSFYSNSQPTSPDYPESPKGMNGPSNPNEYKFK